MSTGAHFGAMAADDRFVITAIVLARLALPLLIPRIPLIILGTLVLDAADNSLLAHFSSVDLGPAGPYQSFDKALDTYTLAVAHLATMRNWIPATPTGRAVARAGRWRGRGVHFALLLPINFLLIYAGSRALSDRGHLSFAAGLFFAYVTTLIVVLYDAYRPLRAARETEPQVCSTSQR